MVFGVVERMFSALIGSLSMVEMRSVIACMRSWLLVLLRFSLRFLLNMSACDDPGVRYPRTCCGWDPDVVAFVMIHCWA